MNKKEFCEKIILKNFATIDLQLGMIAQFRNKATNSKNNNNKKI